VAEEHSHHNHHRRYDVCACVCCATGDYSRYAAAVAAAAALSSSSSAAASASAGMFPHMSSAFSLFPPPSAMFPTSSSLPYVGLGPLAEGLLTAAAPAVDTSAAAGEFLDFMFLIYKSLCCTVLKMLGVTNCKQRTTDSSSSM